MSLGLVQMLLQKAVCEKTAGADVYLARLVANELGLSCQKRFELCTIEIHGAVVFADVHPLELDYLVIDLGHLMLDQVDDDRRQVLRNARPTRQVAIVTRTLKGYCLL